jgi:hypothetical protein
MDAPHEAGCYLIHFKEKFGQAGHYTGSADDIAERINDHLLTMSTPPDPGEVKWHKDGPGAKLMGVINYHFIEWSLERVWTGRPNFRVFEAELKNYKNARLLCPICSGAAAYRRMP